MLSNCSRNIENIITKLLIDGRYKKALEIGQRKYQIKQFKISSLAPNQIFCMYYSFSTRFYINRTETNQQSWYENELRVYIWLLVCYSYLQERCVADMTQQDWLFFSHLFNNRNPEIFQFQALSILRRETKFIKWTAEEIGLLASIIKSKKVKNKWNEIAKQLFFSSQRKFFRTAKQCREHWINHLDPTPIRSNWRASEDYELVKAVQMVGKRWAKVSKMLNGKRTEHMVKNRFKSLQQSQMKILNESFVVNVSEDQILVELQKRLRLMCIEELSEAEKQKQIQKSDEIDKIPSAEEKMCEIQEKKSEVIHTEDPLELQDENNEQDQLLKFTLKTQTIHSFRNVYDDQCKIPDQKQECGEESFNNFFNSEYIFN